MALFIILFFSAFFPLPLSSSNPHDEACLTNLIKSFQDPFKNLQNWTESTFAHPCSGFTSYLPGATCNNSRIYQLSLTNLSLHGCISPFISNCTNLQSLNLSSNSISGSIPQDLRYLINLEVLDLHDNLFTGQIPPALRLLPKLSAFDVSHNNLSGYSPRLNDSSSERKHDLPPVKNEGLSVLTVVGIGLVTGVVSLVVSLTVVCICLRITDQNRA